MSIMTPIAIPNQAAIRNPGLAARHIGPPPGVSEEDCGTVEALVGFEPDGYPVFADYWRPSAEELSDLAAGGYIELRQYAPQMVMHSMAVWPPEEAS